MLLPWVYSFHWLYCGHRIKKPYNSCKDNEKLNPHSKSSVLLMKISTSRCLKHPWTLAQRYKWHMCLISYDKDPISWMKNPFFCRFCYLLLNAIYGLVRKIFWNGEGGGINNWQNSYKIMSLTVEKPNQLKKRILVLFKITMQKFFLKILIDVWIGKYNVISSPLIKNSDTSIRL